MDKPPTLAELRQQWLEGKFDRPSRYKKSPCKVCARPVTNNALGRWAHKMMHIRSRRAEGAMSDEELSTNPKEKEEPTDDERAAMYYKTVEAIGALTAELKAKGYKKGNGGSGSIPCPACEKGQLRYSIAGSNGHLLVRCTTDGCVRFMQ